MKNTAEALAEVKKGQHILDTYHLFNQNYQDL